MQCADLLKSLGDNSNIVLAKQSTVQTVVGPNDVLHAANSHLGQLLLLLNVEENNGGRGDEQEATSATEIDVCCAGRGLDSLGSRVAEILNVDLLGGRIEDGETVTGNEDS